MSIGAPGQHAPFMIRGDRFGLRHAALRLDRGIGWLTEAVGAVIVVAETCILFAGVVSRYVFDSPIIWTDELGGFLFLWLSMFGTVVALRRDGHMRLTTLVSWVRPSYGRWCSSVGALVVVAFVLLILLPALSYVDDQQYTELTTLGISDGWRVVSILFGMSLAAGPQWTGIDSPGLTPTLSLFANLSASYAGKFSHATIAYSRSSNSGFGVVGGAISNSVTFSTGRTFDRVWFCALTSAYTQTANLPTAASLPFTFHTTVAGVQVSRALTRSLSAYASYTLQNQSNQGAAAAVDLFSGLSNIAGFGITFSPSAVRLGGHS